MGTQFHKKTGPVSITKVKFDSSREFALISDSRLKIVGVCSGSVNFEINGVLYNATEGDVFILSAVDLRRWKKVNGEGFEICMVSFPSGLNMNTSAFYIRNNGFSNKITNPLIRRNLFLLLQMMCEFTQKNSSFSFVSNMLGVMCEYVKAEYENVKSDNDADFVIKIMDYIHKNAKGLIDCVSAAKYMALSPSHFSRRFKTALSMPFSAYLRQYRVYLVLGEMQKKNQNIMQCAYRSGFSSSAGFYKAFKEVTKMSPSEYLKEC